MKFNLIKYYDTHCDKCGNWASGDMGVLQGNRPQAEKKLFQTGWRVIKGEVICNYCLNGEERYIPRNTY